MFSLENSLDGKRCLANGTENVATTISGPQTFEDSDSSIESKSQSNTENFQRSSSDFDIPCSDETFKTHDKLLYRFSFQHKSKKKRSSKSRLNVPLNNNHSRNLPSPEYISNKSPKLERTDSFLKRFVKTSKDNLTENCERLVRNIQKSPSVLKKKLLFTWSSDSLGSSKSGDKPVPPLRRKRSIKRKKNCDCLERKENFTEKEENFEEEKKERPTFFLDPDSQNYNFEPRVSLDDIPRSESVSLEDVDDIIKSEDNFNLLQERYNLRKKLKTFENSISNSENKSRSDENLRFPRIDSSDIDYFRLRKNCRQLRDSIPDLGEDQGRVRLDRKLKKLKSSPPPDEVQVQRSPRLQQIHDKQGSDKQGLTDCWISNDSSAHSDVSDVSLLGIKCRFANFANTEERLKSGGNAILPSVESLCRDSLATDQTTDQNNFRSPGEKKQELSKTIFESSKTRPLNIGKKEVLNQLTEGDSKNNNFNQLPRRNSKDVQIGINCPRDKEVVNSKGLRKRLSLKRSLRLKKKQTMKLAVKIMRMRERLIVGLSAFAILFTIFLVMDLQLDLGYSGHHLVSSHGRVKFGEDPNRDTVYNNFRRKFLQRANVSKEQSGGDVSGTLQTLNGNSDITKGGERTEKRKVHDNFADLNNIVNTVENYENSVVFDNQEDRRSNHKIGEIRKIPLR